jgi:putative ABC transport system permease protein
MQSKMYKLRSEAEASRGLKPALHGALTLFHRLILRPLRRERLRTSLTIGAVALGVAAVVAIELAGEAAAGSFHSSMETLIGRADFEAISIGGVAPETLTRLAKLPYALTLHPRIEDYAVLEDSHRTVPLLGIDLVGTPGDGIWTGNELGYKAGDRVKLLAGNSSRELRVEGVLGANSGETVVMDLALAARLLGRERLDRIHRARSAHPACRKRRPGLVHSLQDGRAGDKTRNNRIALHTRSCSSRCA